MRKSFILALVALTGASVVSCSSDNDGPSTPTVGITSVQVTPAGSAKSYACVISQSTMVIENTNDSVDWDVADAALTNTKIEATGTLGSTVYYNNEPISNEGVEVDASSPVTLTAKDNSGNAKTYTLKVVKEKTASGEDMVKKASTFAGFPTGLLDYDMTFFNGKFYAITTSLSGSGEAAVENYQLFKSEDGLHWTEVDYKTDATGVNLPEGQTSYVIGGEGARLTVMNGRMYVLGGARTMGADKYGNAAETTSGWSGPAKSIDNWRSFSTADGETFKCDTVGITLKDTEGTVQNPKYNLPAAYLNVATLKDKTLIQGGFYFGFGMAQGCRRFAMTSDGTNWTSVTPVSNDPDCDVKNRNGSALFVFKNKFWCVGGFTNFIGGDNFLRTSVYSSTDGINWEKEGELNGAPTLYHAKVIAGNDVAFMVGGEYIAEDGSTRMLSNKIYRTTDGLNWEEVITVPNNYIGVRNAAGVALGNTAWIFGGNKTVTTGFYGYPMGDSDELSGDTWIKLFK